MAACLQDKGWDVTSNPDGSYSADVPTDQLELFEESEFECAAEQGPVEPVSREEAEVAFDEWLETADCIRNLGHDVEEPPSQEAAIEAMMQPIRDLQWDPYEIPAKTLPQEEMNEVYLACPLPSLY